MLLEKIIDYNLYNDNLILLVEEKDNSRLKRMDLRNHNITSEIKIDESRSFSIFNNFLFVTEAQRTKTIYFNLLRDNLDLCQYDFFLEGLHKLHDENKLFIWGYKNSESAIFIMNNKLQCEKKYLIGKGGFGMILNQHCGIQVENSTLLNLKRYSDFKNQWSVNIGDHIRKSTNREDISLQYHATFDFDEMIVVSVREYNAGFMFTYGIIKAQGDIIWTNLNDYTFCIKHNYQLICFDHRTVGILNIINPYTGDIVQMINHIDIFQSNSIHCSRILKNDEDYLYFIDTNSYKIGIIDLKTYDLIHVVDIPNRKRGVSNNIHLVDGKLYMHFAYDKELYIVDVEPLE